MVVIDVTAGVVNMDPWGDAGHVNASAEGISGFDDDFSDATMTIPNGSDGTRFPNPPVSSSAQIPPINFIPRLQPNDNDFPAASSFICSSSSSLHGATNTQPAQNILRAFPPSKDPLTNMMSSEEYISRLEAKLKRIRGGGGGGLKEGRKCLSSSAKQMIDALSTVKESHVLLSSDGGDAFSESSRMDINPNFLMQRAFPERTPLTREELEWLVNHDQLQPPNNDDDDDDDGFIANTSS